MTTAGQPATGIVVRAAAPADAGPVAAIYAPVVDDTAISFEEVPPGPDEISVVPVRAGVVPVRAGRHARP